MAGGSSGRDLLPHREHRQARHDSSLTVNPGRSGTAVQGPQAATPSDRGAGRAGRTTGSLMPQSTSLSSRHTKSPPTTGYAAPNGGSPPLSGPRSLSKLAPEVLRSCARNSRRSPRLFLRRRDGRSARSKTRRSRYSGGSESPALLGWSHVSSLSIWCRCLFLRSPQPHTRCGPTASCSVSWTVGIWLAAGACDRSRLPDRQNGSEPRYARSLGAVWSRSPDAPPRCVSVPRTKATRSSVRSRMARPSATSSPALSELDERITDLLNRSSSRRDEDATV